MIAIINVGHDYPAYYIDTDELCLLDKDAIRRQNGWILAYQCTDYGRTDEPKIKLTGLSAPILINTARIVSIRPYSPTGTAPDFMSWVDYLRGGRYQ